MNEAFWRGRRVLLTGHTGFKGAWLSLWLQSLGAQVTGFALHPAAADNLFDAARVDQGMHSIIGDLRDERAVRAAVETARPEVVIHMAAQALVRDSYERPVETYAVNVLGTAHVLDALRSCPEVRAIVVVTSDKVYRNAGRGLPFTERSELGGHDPYSSSKACTELVAEAYRLSFFGAGPALATARAGNVIGGGDRAANRLVPDLLQAFSRGEQALIRNPGAVRPWQHVLEPLRGYLLLAQKLCQEGAGYAQAWNFGPRQDDAIAVEDLAARLAALWGGGAFRVQHEAHAGHEAVHLSINAGKASERLGWDPLLDIGNALRLTVEWARSAGRGADARALCLAQIAEYSSLSRS